MKVLLLSAYAAASHQHWADSLAEMLPDWQWRTLSLPPRHFSWRVRGNPLYWSLAEREDLEADYDRLVATSMVDLATLRGLVPALARLPTLLYFHENQFAYPRRVRRHSPVEAQITSLYSALAADRLAFNSGYNRDSFLAGCDELLARLPDRVPPGVVAALAEKSLVLPVPVAPPAAAPEGRSCHWAGTSRWPDGPLRLLWVGRLEYDKGAAGLLATVRALEREGIDYRLAVAGQRFRDSPSEFTTLESEFGHRLVHFGYLPSREALHALMTGADLVLSTALHEFQGLAVMEAVLRGCVPVLPCRLAYPEIYGRSCCYPSTLEDPLVEGAAAAAMILRRAGELAGGAPLPASPQGWEPAVLGPRYRALLEALEAHTAAR